MLSNKKNTFARFPCSMVFLSLLAFVFIHQPAVRNTSLSLPRLHYTPITIALTRTSFGVRIVITAFGLRKSAFSTCSHPPIQSDFSPILLPVVQTSTEASKHPLDSSSARHAERPPCACDDFCISLLVFGCFWLFFVIFCLQTSLGFAFLRLRFRKLQISSYVMKLFSHIFHIIGCCCCRFSAVRLHC